MQLVPQFHYASHNINRFRFGFSITAPAGLSKKWDDMEPEATAKEFTLKTIEFNPTIAYKLNNNMGIAFGWNIAFSTQNDNKNTKFAITYRSKVDLTLKGDASGYIGAYNFNSIGRVNIPIPAILNIAFAKTINKTTYEFVFERSFWSKYQVLDFNFDDPIVENAFGIDYSF